MLFVEVSCLVPASMLGRAALAPRHQTPKGNEQVLLWAKRFLLIAGLGVVLLSNLGGCAAHNARQPPALRLEPTYHEPDSLHDAVAPGVQAVLEWVIPEVMEEERRRVRRRRRDRAVGGTLLILSGATAGFLGVAGLTVAAGYEAPDLVAPGSALLVSGTALTLGGVVLIADPGRKR